MLYLRTTDFEINYSFSQEIFLSWKRMASAPFLMMDFSVMLHRGSSSYCFLMWPLQQWFQGGADLSALFREVLACSRGFLPAPWISKPGRVFLHNAPLKRDHSVYLWIRTNDFCFLDGIEGKTVNIIALVIITPFKIFFHSCISHLVNS